MFDDSGNFLLYATMIGVKGGCGHVLYAVWQSDSPSLSFSDQSRHQQMRQDHRKGASYRAVTSSEESACIHMYVMHVCIHTRVLPSVIQNTLTNKQTNAKADTGMLTIRVNTGGF